MRNDRWRDVHVLHVSLPEHFSRYEELLMPPTTVEPKVSLEPQQRAWLKKMAAALQIKLGGSAEDAGGNAADAALMAKCQQIKAAIVPKVKDAIAADASKRDKIKELLETAGKQEAKGSYAEAFETWKDLTTTVKEALGISATSAAPEAPTSDAATGKKGGTKTAPTGKTPTSTTPPTPPPSPSGKAPTPPVPPTPVEDKTPPKSPEQIAYEKELDEVKKLVAALNKHAHKAHIAGELTAINTELGKADTAAKAKNYTDAMKDLAKAKETAGKAKDFADKYEAYAKKRADAQFLTNAFKDALDAGVDSAGNPTYLQKQLTAITDADNLAKPPSRDYAGATTKVDGVANNLKKTINDWYVTPNTPKIQALKTGSQKTFLADQIKVIEDQFKILNANIAANDFRKALLQGPRVNGLIAASTAASSRRGNYDSQRPKTVTAIDGLKPFTALSTQMDGLNKQLKTADDQASIETRQFENAVEALTKIEGDAKALAKNGPAAETYANDRKAADQAFDALSKHKQAATQKPLLAGIKTKLDKAAELAKDPAKVATANAELKLAKQQIDNAAHVLGEVDKVSVAAGTPQTRPLARRRWLS